MDSILKIDRNRDFGVVGFGTNAVDYLITVPTYPEFDSKVRLDSYQRAAGGEVASTLVGLSRLGIRGSYIGRFGSDAEGRYGLDSLKAEGVDVVHAEIIEGATTQIAFILIDAVSGERTVIWDRDQKLSYSSTEVPAEIVSRASIFHCTPHDVDACLRLTDEAQRSGTLVSMDIDNLFEGVEALLSRVDVLVASRDLPGKLTGKTDPEESLAIIRETHGCSIVGITLGQDGCLLLSDNGIERIPGYSVPGGCKDTTGAGDAFRSGLLYGILNNFTIRDSGMIANAVAALKCRAVGARTALPDLSEVEELTGLKVSR
jgi:sulfofructose kinase